MHVVYTFRIVSLEVLQAPSKPGTGVFVLKQTEPRLNENLLRTLTRTRRGGGIAYFQILICNSTGSLGNSVNSVSALFAGGIVISVLSSGESLLLKSDLRRQW